MSSISKIKQTSQKYFFSLKSKTKNNINRPHLPPTLNVIGNIMISAMFEQFISEEENELLKVTILFYLIIFCFLWKLLSILSGK